MVGSRSNSTWSCVAWWKRSNGLLPGGSEWRERNTVVLRRSNAFPARLRRRLFRFPVVALVAQFQARRQKRAPAMNDITRTTVSVGEGPPQPIGGTLIVLAIDHFARPDGLTDHRISQFIANGMLARDRRSLALGMRAPADPLDP